MPHVDRLNTIVRLGRVDHVAVADGLRIGNFGEGIKERVRVLFFFFFCIVWV